MNYRSLAGIQVSEIGFGGWGIGGRDWGPTDDVVSIRALNEAFDRGITFYDTAPSYGRSEMLIGETFRDRRDKVVICTKTKDFDISESLRHFGYIDVLLLHGIPGTPEGVTLMSKLIEQGKVRRYGLSAKTPADASPAYADLAFKIIEVNLSMMDTRAIDLGLLNGDNAVIARTPLNFGFLTGLINGTTDWPLGHHLKQWSPEQIADWIKHARECLGDTPPGRESVRKALDWVLAHPVSTCIVGMMTPEQVEDAT